MKRIIILVADGVGCGEAPDAADYGDAGANTLGNLARAAGGLALPHLGALGLGRVTAIEGVPPAQKPEGAFGKMQEASAGKDTITGHWEMAGLVQPSPLATFPKGFPAPLIEAFERVAGRKAIGNKTASGTAILDELGPEHLRTGALIVYTSADSVFQIAAHEEKVPLPELYRICEATRRLCDEYQIGRVIARPFVGAPGGFRRTYNRKDYPLPPPGETVLDALVRAGVPVVGVGKIGDIFAMRGIDENVHTEGNTDGLAHTLDRLARMERGLLFVNLVDFDMLYGHRNDVPGFARCLGELDAFVPRLRAALAPGDLVLVTADHGNDPTTLSTDHSREFVPLLAFGPGLQGRDLGTRTKFCDLGQTVAEAFGLPPLQNGESFLGELFE